MIYSVFDPSKGIYSYFETPENKAVNSDLPIPSFRSDAGKIGVAAIDAARPLPAQARKVGEGWTARGILASSDGLSGLGSFVGPGEPVGTFVLAGIAGAVVGAATASWYDYRRATPRQTSAGAGTFGAMAGFALGLWAAKKAS